MRQLFYDGSRSLPPFFGWMPARGWIAGRALRVQRAGPGGRAAERGRVGAPTELWHFSCDWAKGRTMAVDLGKLNEASALGHWRLVLFDAFVITC